MIDRSGAVLACARRAWLLGFVLVVAPLAGGCVSAVDDSSAFGFNAGAIAPPEAAPTSVAAVDPALMTEGEAAGQAAAPAPPPASGDAASVAEAAAGQGGAAVASAAPAPSATSPFLSNAASVAAFAGGTVTGAAPPGEAAGARSGGTLFSSLFTSEEAKTPIANAERTRERRVILQREGAPIDVGGGDALPGVDPSSLFEIGQRTSLDDEEYMEDTGVDGGTYEVASLTGMARLTPNGLLVQRQDIVTQCFEPKLVNMLRAIERKFGAKVVVTSGYRSPAHNRRVNGARQSQHMACKAADIVVPGVDRFALANFARTLPGRGGVGTYCHTSAVHVDIGRQRDWNWGCRRRG